MNKLHVLDLSSNSFNGSIPTRFLKQFKAMMVVSSGAPSIEAITVMLKGREITLVHILSAFMSIDLSNNNVEGIIPDEIGDLKLLKELNLSRNSFSSRIPHRIANMLQLESLDLSDNQLSGEIPPAMAQMSFLEVLNLSYNRLSGPIPQSSQFLTFPATSFLGNDGLCGKPLPRQCNTAGVISGLAIVVATTLLVGNGRRWLYWHVDKSLLYVLQPWIGGQTMASLCRSAAAARSAALRSRSPMARLFLAATSPVSPPRIRRPLVAAALASLESLMPLHSAVASAGLRSCIAAGSACWSCLSQAAALASLESLMPLHSAVASARLRSCIAAGSACWSCLSQGLWMMEDCHLLAWLILFRCLGKAAYAALYAISQNLSLTAFSHLLHDNPLPLDEVSALELMVSFSHGHPESSHAPMVGLKLSMAEVDRGLVTLVASDHPGFEVCNPNGYWYLADVGSSPDVLLLLTGRALASLMFRLMPRANAILSFVAGLNPEFTVPSRLAIEEMCDAIFDETRKDLFSRLSSITGRVSLGVGTAKTTEAEGVSYIACCFIDNEWKRHQFVIDAYVAAADVQRHYGPIFRVDMVDDALEYVIQVMSHHRIDHRLSMVAYETTDDDLHPKLKGYLDKRNSDTNPSSKEISFATYVDSVLHTIARCLLPNNQDFIREIYFDIDCLYFTRQMRHRFHSRLGLDNHEQWCACYYSLKMLLGNDKCSSSIADGADSYSSFSQVFHDKAVADVLKEAKDHLDKAIQNSYLIWSIPLVLDPRYKLTSCYTSFSGSFDCEAAVSYFSQNIEGNYGSVYKGSLSLPALRNAVVAVKVFTLQQSGSSRSFLAECEALRRLKHRNLINIITRCSSVDTRGNDFQALVFEFMPNYSLDRWLHWQTNVQLHKLNLIQLLNIAVDVANAIDYLHNNSRPSVIHCDLKPNNILLDSDWTAYVADFRLSKLIGESMNISRSYTGSSIGIRETVGYVAPEYGGGGQVSTAGDAYSFGITLLEMFTGKAPTDDMIREGLSLHLFAEMALPDKLPEIVDTVLLEVQPYENAAKVGISCSKQTPSERMSMENAAIELHRIRDVGNGPSV
uniref:non-specific serine/threonine protein kinase n=1 Tax=Saccharum spontaneum TaxID=62335 RepID=A0A678T4J8_SACSP|nr:hypothetical protein SS48H02_000005 [Saccharum spontaneum]